MPVAVLFSGRRENPDRADIERVFRTIPHGSYIVVGDAHGTDAFVIELIAKHRLSWKLQYAVCPYVSSLAKRGGHARNSAMAAYLAQLKCYGLRAGCVAWPRSDGTGGTMHCMDACMKWSLPVADRNRGQRPFWQTSDQGVLF